MARYEEDAMTGDTADLAAVPPADQLDEDGGAGSDALVGGADDELEDVYADPGPVVEEPFA